MLINYSFELFQYQIGKKYVEYWENNPEKYEQVKHNQNFTFFPLQNSFESNDLILFGEAHGTMEAQKIDLQLIQHLNNKHNMKHHVVELDFSQAFFLNKFLQNGKDSLINFALQNWSVEVGQNNEGYYQKWKKLYQYNLTLKNEKKIKVIGIDKVQDFSVTKKHIELLLAELNIFFPIPSEKEDLIYWASKDLPQIIEGINIDSNNRSIIEDLEHIQNNLLDYNIKNRITIMKDNFLSQYYRYNLKDKKVYGYFGFFHVLQHETNYKELPVILESAIPNLKNNIFSLVTLLSDSYIPLPSEDLLFFFSG